MSLADIKKLRDMTSLGINDCKRALCEAKGDFNKALEILKKRGIETLQKKSARTAQQGRIDSYIHFGANLGVLVEVNCETDFVARTDVFKAFVKDLAMQIAAANPQYIKKEDVSKEVLRTVEDSDAYYKQSCLLEQPFIKDNQLSVADYLHRVVSQIGENVIIKRFARFSLGEEL